ncbi:hypothetical protein BOTBODRAFT_624533 [Botryobasidium botryosum FD-172 SS1]|uniref:AAA+ ATPase domain-containing protein n=1 Tax=Botryobasidium botryosum (strain FD-172 SS1) TaxID=930990 RepID=A0A067MJ92_BOTB1|nr:hypothetical protein BOTBODRAFT_624533 [Botryobasidium botryosum FD-172 SS1]
MGLGAALAGLRKGSVLLSTLVQRRMLVTLEISSKDHAYPWFLEWMAAHAQKQKALAAAGSRKLGIRLEQRLMRSHELSVDTMLKQHDNGSSEVQFSLVPGPGTHWIKYQGAWMQVKRERQSKIVDIARGTPFELVTLTTLSRDRVLFPKLLSEAREIATSGQEGKVVVYTAWNAEWKPFGPPRRKRELKSVVLGDGVSKRIEDDVKGFLKRGKWYAERGIPYRRGYLLHGPPGSGKTSFIQALAGNLSYNICLLNLSQRGMMDDKLNHLLMNVPPRSFVLLEDVDAAFNKRVQSSEDGYQSGVTLSGLLNALDGVASAEERIVFMTTNHVSRLDPALIRPGRIDVQELLDDASPTQARELFMRFYEGYSPIAGDDQSSVAPSEDVAKMAEQLENIVREEMDGHQRRVSMASLQGHFIRHDAHTAVQTCRDLFSTRVVS